MDILRQAVKFGLVGTVNTAVGLLVIYSLMLGFDFSPVFSNVGGYAVGLCVSFTLNSLWTFRQPMSLNTALRFLLAFVISYGVNLAVLLILIGPVRMSAEWAQILAIMSYTMSFFVISRMLVFRSGAACAPEVNANQ